MALADLIDEHRGAFEYDWRARFGKSLRAIGRSISWGEAARLAERLAQDISSEVGAALAGWQYPATREALIAMDAYDAFAQATFKRPQPYPRPWDKPPVRHGNASLTPEEFRAVIDKHRAATSAEEADRG